MSPRVRTPFLRRPPASAERDQRLTGCDSDVHLEAAVLRQPVPYNERGSHGSLGVVLVRDRRAEDGNHCIADELLDRPAEALELGADALMVRLEQSPHVLGIHRLGAGSEPHEVAEEAGDDLALLSRYADVKLGAATRAEARVGRVLAPAAGAGLHGERIGRA
jgi:hypothetical protein